jgi:hypothetical protein
MKLHRIVPGALVALMLGPVANAALFRAYVKSTGSDANPCTLAAPCRLVAGALAAVDAGGEIWMLDSANYNTSTVAIAKSVSILAIPGAVGSLVAIGGPAVSITTAGLKVSVRNVVFTQLVGGGGTDGIQLFAMSAVQVEKSVFANLPGNGIVTQTGSVRVVDSTMRNIAGAAVQAVATSSVVIVGTQILECGTGVDAISPEYPDISVSDSVIAGCNKGVIARKVTTGSGFPRVRVTRTVLDGNGIALESAGGSDAESEIMVSGSTISGGTQGWSISGPFARIVSLGNNHFANATGSGTLTSGALQ